MLPEKLLTFSFLDLIVLILATYRLSVMLANDWEAGPGNILTKLRKAAGLIHTEAGAPVKIPGSLAEGMMCEFCNSIWIGLVLTLIYMFFKLVQGAYGFPAIVLFLPFALSGGSVLLVQLFDRLAR